MIEKIIKNLSFFVFVAYGVWCIFFHEPTNRDLVVLIFGAGAVTARIVVERVGK